MASTSENHAGHRESTECYSFMLLLDNPEKVDEILEEKIYQRCPDATLAVRDEKAYLAFDRCAASLEDAIASALSDAFDLRLDVVRVIPPAEEMIDAVNEILKMGRIVDSRAQSDATIAAKRETLQQVLRELMQQLLKSEKDNLGSAIRQLLKS